MDNTIVKITSHNDKCPRVIEDLQVKLSVRHHRVQTEMGSSVACNQSE